MSDQYQHASLETLFLLEAQAQTQLLDQALIALYSKPNDKVHLETCMRAAHSLKGAARLVGVESAVGVSHEMEALLVHALRGTHTLSTKQVELLMQGSAALLTIAEGKAIANLAALISAFAAQNLEGPLAELPIDADIQIKNTEPLQPFMAEFTEIESSQADEDHKKSSTIRVSSERLDLLLDLASRALVESKHAQHFGLELLKIKKMQVQAKNIVELLRDRLVEEQLPEYFLTALTDLRQLFTEANAQTLRSLEHYDSVSWQALLLNQNLYDAALACRMRPFSDLFTGKARMVFELGNRLNKKVQLLVEGEHTSVDRDMLARLESPVLHLLSNAVDHGIETSDERKACGKPELATIRLKAWHASGYLQMEISDDGRGINMEKIKARVLSRNLVTATALAQMDEQELLAFLFLPDFTLAQQVSVISGRGIGLDAVQHEIKALGGHIELFNHPGTGCNFRFRLPVTVSVIRCVVIEVAGEIYAIPLHRIETMLRLQQDDLVTVEGRPHFWWQGDAIGIMLMSQLLELTPGATDPLGLGVLVFKEHDRKIALAVEKLLGEQSLVVMHMDPRFGHLSAVMAGAVLADGTPTLILNVDDILVKAQTLLNFGQINSFTTQHTEITTKKILVVDDSLTVRELERKLLSNRGYQVKVAVDGLEGWTMLKAEKFDLLVSDIDMPKMDGIELVRLVRADLLLNRLPVVIVSYKDREEDKSKGLEAGADYYLAKSSFHDETLVEAVQILIGVP
jgi:two-component system sensor histidine kinase and response regulator WspE